MNFACAQCHGLDGQGGVSPFVPALKDAQGLTSAGAETDHRPRAGVSANPKQPYMPVWGQVISDRQVDDLVAYIHAGLPAVPTATPVQVPTGQGPPSRAGPVHPLRVRELPRPERPRRGAQPAVARQDDPAALGADFFSEFNTDAKIRDVIVSGSVLGKAPIVSMPHWGGIIPPARLNALVAYIKTLKGKT